MNKTDLETEVKRLETENKRLKKDNDFMFKQQSSFKKMAERAGSELAPYKAMVKRLEEEMSRLVSTLKSQGDKK